MDSRCCVCEGLIGQPLSPTGNNLIAQLWQLRKASLTATILSTSADTRALDLLYVVRAE
jgi:hypothetical protein